jgi:hypothetical protein
MIATDFNNRVGPVLALPRRVTGIDQRRDVDVVMLEVFATSAVKRCKRSDLSGQEPRVGDLACFADKLTSGAANRRSLVRYVRKHKRG